MPRVKLFDQELVLQKAMNLFWEKGFHATSVQDLVNNLEISRGSLYDTYGGKQELFDQSLEHYKQDTLEWLTSFLNTEKDVKKGIRKLMESIIDRGLTDPEYNGCFVTKTCDGLSANDQVLKASMAEYHMKVHGIICDYIRSGNIDSSKNIDAIANLIMTINTGFSISSRVISDRTLLMGSVDEALSLLD